MKNKSKLIKTPSFNQNNCNFTNNSAEYDGGAIYFSSSGTVTNCNLTNNAATGDGGAIWMSSGSVENCNFTDNHANYGGAILFDGTGTVSNCNFTNNKATGDYGRGGAIYFSSSGTTHEVRNCNFTDNHANYAGAVYFYRDGTVTNCNFTNNKATGEDSWGGAIYMSSGSVENCNFTNNSASRGGGAVYFVNNGNVTNCNFTNNSASVDGGAIIMGSGTVSNCNFVNNSATGEDSSWGGAIRMYSGTVSNCNFADNSANRGGAILSAQYLGVTADTCIFKTDSDTTFNTHILPPALNVDNFTTFYGSGKKLTFDLRTNLKSIPVTNGNISISVYFKENNSWVRNYSCLSGEGWIPELPVGSYYAIFNTEYAEFQPINRTITITIPKTQYYINVTSLTTNNKTVNITAKSNIPKDLFWDGKLLFY